MFFPCPDCGIAIDTKRTLLKHIREVHKREPSLCAFTCGHCNSIFTTSKNLLRHLRNVHKFKKTIRCNACPKIFGHESTLCNHRAAEHSTLSSSTFVNGIEWASVPQFSKAVSALNCQFKILRLDVQQEGVNPFALMMSNRSDIALLIDKEITNQGISRAGLCIQVVLSKPLDGESVSPCFSTRPIRVVKSINECDLNELVDQLLRQLNVFCSGGSGWVLEKILSMDNKVCKTRSLAGSSFIPTPTKLARFRYSLLNITNLSENCCFIYCILVFLYPCLKNRERPSNYSDKFDRLIFDTSSMPMKLRDIPKSETNNSSAITVLSLDDEGSLFCCHRSKLKGNFRKVFLLLLTDGLNSLYCLITNFQNLMHKLCRSLGEAEKGRRTNFCVNCMQSIGKSKYADHIRLCEDNQPLRVVMPSEELKLKFVNWEKTQKCPFVVYADFEALNVAVNVAKGKSTVILERQVPASYGAILVDGRTNSVIAESFYRGEDSIKILMNCLPRWNNWCDSERPKNKILNDVMSKSHQKAYLALAVDMNCGICNDFVAVYPVIHHWHSTGKVLGIAHSNCNLRAQMKRILPVLFENLSRYHAHHILKSLIVRPGQKLSAISRTDEVYISFSLRNKFSEYICKDGRYVPLYSEIRFLDSFQFMSQSLESLAKTIQTSSLQLLRNKFSDMSDFDFEKIRGKCFFPYNYLDSFEKISQPFPAYGDAWRNSFSGKTDISEREYEMAKEIYTLMRCNNFGDSRDFYLILDANLLADIFEAFRCVCLKEYHLHTVNFFSAPNLSWEGMLNTTKVELGLLSDIDMLLFCERAIRGGINGIGATRHFKANNKYMEDFDKFQPSVFGAFFDITSLYAGTMQQPLPCGNYKGRNDLTVDDILNADCFGGVGYFVEIDLEYPPHLHDHLNDLPLAPEKLQIITECLSDYAKSFGIPASRVAKLMETLFDKSFSICHFRKLKFYVEKGLTVKHLHRVLQFDQSCSLGNFISKNTALRKEAKTDFDKNFFKLPSNACFGKTMENLRNRRQTKFLSTEPEAKTCTLKPTFLKIQIIHDSLVSVNFTQSSIFWNKPTPVGSAILDLSKIVLHKFHYNEMEPKFGDSLKVVYKDTDSLLYRIETNDLYSDMESFKHSLNLSDYPQKHKLFDSTNKKSTTHNER